MCVYNFPRHALRPTRPFLLRAPGAALGESRETSVPSSTRQRIGRVGGRTRQAVTSADHDAFERGAHVDEQRSYFCPHFRLALHVRCVEKAYEKAGRECMWIVVCACRPPRWPGPCPRHGVCPDCDSLVPGRAVGTCRGRVRVWSAGFRRAGPRVATRTSRPRPRRTDSPPRPPRYPVEAPFNWRRYYRYGHTKRQYRPAARRSKSDHGIRLLVWFYDCARDAIINLWGQYPAPTGAFGELFSRTEDCAPRPRARGPLDRRGGKGILCR